MIGNGMPLGLTTESADIGHAGPGLKLDFGLQAWFRRPRRAGPPMTDTTLIDRALACARRTIALRVDACLRGVVDHMRECGATDEAIAEMLVLTAEASSERALYAETRATLERAGAPPAILQTGFATINKLTESLSSNREAPMLAMHWAAGVLQGSCPMPVLAALADRARILSFSPPRGGKGRQRRPMSFRPQVRIDHAAEVADPILRDLRIRQARSSARNARSGLPCGIAPAARIWCKPAGPYRRDSRAAKRWSGRHSLRGGGGWAFR